MVSKQQFAADLPQILRNGSKSGLYVLWDMGKLIVPIYFIMSLLQDSGLLTIISQWLEPAMSLIGLPGEAAAPICLGMAVNLYSVLGAVAALDLTYKQVTILSAFCLAAHSLFLEGAVMSRAGGKAWLLTLLRIGFAFLFCIILNWLL